MPMKRLLPSLLSILLAGAAVAAPEQTIKVAGLDKGAEILVDKWGVPHIYAQSQDDAFFAQGFNAARARLFQIDLWRRRGLGELSSVFGPSYIEQDKATRLFLYRGDMRKEWASYGKDAQRISERFVAGINAYVDYTAQNPAALPFEFRQLGYAPAKWKAEDVVRIRSHGLTRNLTLEVARAAVACKAGLAADQVRSTLQPAWQTEVPAGLDPCLPAGLLDVFKLATDNVIFGKSPTIAALDPEQRMEGSNNWVVAPSKSATGRPIMANDPHRAYSAPSLRYIAHLNAPGMNVIGAGEPALPGISIGHNGTIAFGLTIFSIDQEDLYVYETNPANPMQYKYRGQWENFKVLKESIPVKGGMAATAEMMFSRHGPVIFTEAAKHRAFAVRSGWLEAGMAPYFGSIDYMQAKNFEQFRKAMLNWGAPTENQVYADTSGNIGWVAGGLTPIRPNWDGLLPVPGDGRYEWNGFLTGDKLPSSFNPKKGWFASANEMNLPDGYPVAQYKLGFEWPNNARRARIGEVLDGKAKVSIDDSMRLQNDLVSIPARRMLALLAPLKTNEPKARAALALLRGWDAVESSQSPQAALFEVWWSRHLNQAYVSAVADPKAAPLIKTADITAMMNALERPAARFGRRAKTRRDELLLSSLGAAYAELEREGGPDPKAWQWGRLHYSYYAHPMSTLTDSLRTKLNVGPFPAQGGANTVNQSSYRTSDFLKINGPSFRVVVDVGNWDNSRAMNTPGQSGDPDNPHYRDLAASWGKGDYFPLLYSRKLIEAATESTIRLQPAR
ncbi:penicillin acylase family protein [Massilia sp. R2A-15]|uniref:penicillin acylase family protein n=1 Tax=Massilia sp. R2A-15 TaxID=3064278 RepID=UPI0027366FDA|nr:penicillin acylase family protein [Massilia sp. R2A-15]WLI88108.1 penicillin acylase family protein [Massilia sp. R2A-15]